MFHSQSFIPHGINGLLNLGFITVKYKNYNKLAEGECSFTVYDVFYEQRQ